MTQSEQLARLEHQRQAALDDAVDDNLDAFKTRVSGLMTSLDGRDADLWTRRGADIDLTAADFENVPAPFRDRDWHGRFSELFAMAQHQAWLEIFAIDTLALAETNGQKLQAIASSMPRAELVSVAKGLIKKRGIEEERLANKGAKIA